MTLHRLLICAAFACVTIFIAGEAAATARLGGVVSLVSGLGNCHDNKIVPGDTLQDTFTLSGATGCDGGSVAADLHAEAATGSIGLRASAAGGTAALRSSQAAAEVQFFDQWLIAVPLGTAPGTINIPVTLKLEGSISPLAETRFNRFLDYSMSIRDLYSAPIPDAPFRTILSANGSVVSTGSFLQTFNGSVNFRYFGPGSALPTTAEVVMTLFLPGLEFGTLDFFNTASIALILPPGYSATTSSGLPLVFAPIPEPGTGGTIALGILLLALIGRRARRLREPHR